MHNDPVNLRDLWGLEGAWTATMWWLTALDGPLPIGDIVYGIGVVVETALLIQTVDAIINNPVPEVLESSSPPPRDSEGNPIPVGNQSPGPLGKGVNAGAEKIGNPGGFGDPGNIPPDPPDPDKDPKKHAETIVGYGLAAVTSVATNTVETLAPAKNTADLANNDEDKKND